MKTLNIIATLFFATLCLTSVGQRKFDLPEYNIDCSNDDSYYRKAKRLLDNNNRDSLFEAYRIFRKLHYFDSTKYSKGILNPDYLKIETINFLNVKKNIIGQWNFEWSGSNWGAGETYKTKKENIIITDNDISFFHGDTLVRQTSYSITNEFSPILKEFTFQIYFQDDKTANNIYFKTTGADYIAHLKFSSDNVALYFGATGFCNHCGYTIYMKQSATNYRLGQ